MYSETDWARISVHQVDLSPEVYRSAMLPRFFYRRELKSNAKQYRRHRRRNGERLKRQLRRLGPINFHSSVHQFDQRLQRWISDEDVHQNTLLRLFCFE